MPEGREAPPERGFSPIVARFADETPDASLEEMQLIAAALAALPTSPKLALAVLRELVRLRQLMTVQSVFEDFVVV
jgi:hypothetical protein